jgi:predicted dehydrogenase
MSAASAQRILKSLEKHDRVVMVGMNHRYRPDVQIVRSFVQSGELGPIESVRGSWHVFRPGRTQLGWRQRKEQSGGGAMLDLGLSILDLGLWLGGNPAPARVSASLDPVGRERSVEQSGSAFVVCENGMSVFVDVTWRHLGEGERFGVGLRGSKGTAAINPLNVWKELHGVAVDVSPTGSVGRENAFTASYRAEWAHFQAAIAGDAKVPALKEHLTLHKVLDGIYRSAFDGRDVTL